MVWFECVVGGVSDACKQWFMNTVAPLENDVDARVFMDPSDTDSQYEITQITGCSRDLHQLV